jgi:hypothetical protein
LVAFVASFVVAIILGAIPAIYAFKRPPDKPVTWGEAMGGAIFVFSTFFWVYGVVPNTWMGWATNGLQWSPDQILLGPHNGFVHLPFTITKQTLRDIVLLIIYGFFITCHVGEWVLWQSRDRVQRKSKSVARRSPFGRPVIKRSSVR